MFEQSERYLGISMTRIELTFFLKFAAVSLFSYLTNSVTLLMYNLKVKRFICPTYENYPCGGGFAKSKDAVGRFLKITIFLKNSESNQECIS